MTLSKPVALEIKEKVRALVPVLRQRTAEINRLGRLPDDIMETLHEIGAYDTLLPAKFGGHHPLAMRDMIEIVGMLAQGNGSAAWSVFINIGNLFVLPFKDEAIKEVLGSDHVGPRTAGAVFNVAHAKGVGRADAGGYWIKGAWLFSSNIFHAAWLLAGFSHTDENGVEQRALALIPRTQVEVADDWHVEGLKGTGSNTAVIKKEVFVPGHRIVTLAEFLAGAGGYDNALNPWVTELFFAVIVGCSTGALECFMELSKKRAPFRQPYATIADAPSTQILVAKVRAQISLAEAALQRSASLIDRAAAREIELTAKDRALMNYEGVYATHMLRIAVEELQITLGSSTATNDDLLGGYVRDVRVGAVHGFMRPDPQAEAFGKLILDLGEPTP